jgi:acyl-CoA thioesterase-1
MRPRSLLRFLGTRSLTVLAAAAVTLGIASASLPHASAATRPLSVVSFGDSVPSGGNCGCSPFPFTYAGLVGSKTGAHVSTTNFARGGFTSADVRKQIETPAAKAAIPKATTVLIMVGANDFPGAYGLVRHGANPDVAYRPVAATVRANVEATVRRVRALHPGPVNVAVLGYWNVFRDGKVGYSTLGAAGMASANKATAHANQALLQAAKSTGSQYVFVYGAFKGKDGKTDPTPLLAFDGNHPNAQGHRAIAARVYAALPRG